MNDTPCMKQVRSLFCGSAVTSYGYGRNLFEDYTDLPVPKGSQCLLQGLTRNGQSMWTEFSFLGQTFQSL